MALLQSRGPTFTAGRLALPLHCFSALPFGAGGFGLTATGGSHTTTDGAGLTILRIAVQGIGSTFSFHRFHGHAGALFRTTGPGHTCWRLTCHAGKLKECQCTAIVSSFLAGGLAKTAGGSEKQEKGQQIETTGTIGHNNRILHALRTAELPDDMVRGAAVFRCYGVAERLRLGPKNHNTMKPEHRNSPVITKVFEVPAQSCRPVVRHLLRSC